MRSGKKWVSAPGSPLRPAPVTIVGYNPAPRSVGDAQETKTMTMLNLTPHAINIITPAGTVTVAPSGTVARCSQTSTPAGEVNGIALSRTTFGAVTGLPEPVEGTLLIVSALVRAALPTRTDLASPGDLVRDAAGNPVGCKGLIVN